MTPAERLAERIRRLLLADGGVHIEPQINGSLFVTTLTYDYTTFHIKVEDMTR